MHLALAFETCIKQINIVLSFRHILRIQSQINCNIMKPKSVIQTCLCHDMFSILVLLFRPCLFKPLE